MADFAENLRRLMARKGATVRDVAVASGVDQRSIKGILSGGIAQPHARTLHRLAQGLGVEVDELFQNPSSLSHRFCDRATNPQVDEVVAHRPELVAGWSQADFDELYSQFGAGGALTPEGALAAIETINRKRDVQAKVDLILETDQGDVLAGMVELLYRKVTLDVDAPHEPVQDR